MEHVDEFTGGVGSGYFHGLYDIFMVRGGMWFNIGSARAEEDSVALTTEQTVTEVYLDIAVSSVSGALEYIKSHQLTGNLNDWDFFNESIGAFFGSVAAGTGNKRIIFNQIGRDYLYASRTGIASLTSQPTPRGTLRSFVLSQATLTIRTEDY